MSPWMKEWTVATEQHVHARWSCGQPGEYFFCGFCGTDIAQGEKFKWVYTNDISMYGGNPLCCYGCGEKHSFDDAKLRATWVAKWDAWRAWVKAPENRWYKSHCIDNP